MTKTIVHQPVSAELNDGIVKRTLKRGDFFAVINGNQSRLMVPSDYVQKARELGWTQVRMEPYASFFITAEDVDDLVRKVKKLLPSNTPIDTVEA